VFNQNGIEFGDGKLLLSGEGSILDFSVSLENLLQIPSIEIYGKPVGDFIEFQGFEHRATTLIYGDHARFEAQLKLGLTPEHVVRSGWIKGRNRSDSVRLESASTVMFGHPMVVLYYWTISNVDRSLLVPEGLPDSWGSIAKLVLNLWQHERILAVLSFVIFSLSSGSIYYNKYIAPTVKLMQIETETKTKRVVAPVVK